MQRPKCMPAGLICTGGLDSIKDEMWFMQAHGCLQRGISVLMIDGPGQGGTLRRHKIVTRADSEVPIGKLHRLARTPPRRRSVPHRRVRIEPPRLLRRAFRDYTHDRPLARAANGCEAAQ